MTRLLYAIQKVNHARVSRDYRVESDLESIERCLNASTALGKAKATKAFR